VEIAIAAADGHLIVFMDDTFAPCVVPATADTDMRGTVILDTVATIPGAVLTIADGGRIRRPAQIQGALVIHAAPTAVFPIEMDTSPGMIMIRGAGLVSDPGATIAILHTNEPSGFILAMLAACYLDNSSVPGVPIVQITPGSAFIWTALEMISHPPTPNLIQGDATTAFFYVHDASSVAVAQALVLGSTLENRLDRQEAIQPSAGNMASRPILTDPAFTGQIYFDITLGIPIWWTGAGAIWVDATGGVV
jgi:hypothetical protein